MGQHQKTRNRWIFKCGSVGAQHFYKGGGGAVGTPPTRSLISLMISVDVKHHVYLLSVPPPPPPPPPFCRESDSGNTQGLDQGISHSNTVTVRERQPQGAGPCSTQAKPTLCRPVGLFLEPTPISTAGRGGGGGHPVGRTTKARGADVTQ